MAAPDNSNMMDRAKPSIGRDGVGPDVRLVKKEDRREAMRTQTGNATKERMLERIRGEFLEMPGLSLTSQQAQRLWSLDEETCRELLECLVDAQFLCRLPNGGYSRLTDGPTGRFQPRMARVGPSATRGRRVEEAS